MYAYRSLSCSFSWVFVAWGLLADVLNLYRLDTARVTNIISIQQALITVESVTEDECDNNSLVSLGHGVRRV